MPCVFVRKRSPEHLEVAGDRRGQTSYGMTTIEPDENGGQIEKKRIISRTDYEYLVGGNFCSPAKARWHTHVCVWL